MTSTPVIPLEHFVIVTTVFLLLIGASLGAYLHHLYLKIRRAHSNTSREEKLGDVL